MQEARKFLTKNGLEVTLRPAVPMDAGSIVRTIKSAPMERSLVLMEQYGKDADSEREYIRKLNREKNLFLVALLDEVVGSLAALQAEGGRNVQTAHVLKVGFHLMEEYRGLGFGSQMLQNYQKYGKGHLLYYVFDLLHFEGYDLTGLPLFRRKELLKKILPASPNIRFSDHVSKKGVLFFKTIKERGLEESSQNILGAHTGWAEGADSG